MSKLSTEPIDLQPFTGQDARHTSLAAPYILHGYRYATDGTIAVRVPCDEPDSEVQYPNVEALKWEGCASAEKPLPPMPPESEWAEGKCSACKGEGRSACRECWGEGSYMCPECGQSRECDVCYGDGHTEEDCEVCGGTGVVRQGPDLSIENAPDCGLLHWKHWHKMSALPNVQIGEPTADRLMAFRFDGGEGVVMLAAHDA